MDAYADRVEGKKAIALTEEEKFKFSDLTKLGKPFWLLTVSCLLIYAVIFPFISTNANQMLQIKYGFTSEEAGFYYSLPYLISAFLCAPFGLVIDKVGRRALFSK